MCTTAATLALGLGAHSASAATVVWCAGCWALGADPRRVAIGLIDALRPSTKDVIDDLPREDDTAGIDEPPPTRSVKRGRNAA